MGLPTVSVLEEESPATDGSKSAAANSADTNVSAELGDDLASTLDLKARNVLECPCLDDLRHGPCGGEFSKAFICFVKSEKPEKGSDCIEPFEKMQHCMSSNSDKFSSGHHSETRKPIPIDGSKLDREDDESDAEESDSDDEDEDEEEAEEVYSSHGLVQPPPEFAYDSIRFPSWYKKGVKKQAR